MRTLFLWCALALLALPLAVHAQAIAPLPAPVSPPPVMTPGYAPGTPPAPVYTPTGAGLPEVGQPGQQGEPVKRSPNRRTLPDEFSPKRKAGVWAVDGASVASERRQLWGIVIPLPEGATSRVAEYEAWNCAMHVEDAAMGANVNDVIRAFPADALRCTVATAQHHCAAGEVERAKRRKERLVEFDLARFDALKVLEAYTATLQAQWCSGVMLTREQRDALAAALRIWDAAMEKDAAQ